MKKTINHKGNNDGRKAKPARCAVYCCGKDAAAVQRQVAACREHIAAHGSDGWRDASEPFVDSGRKKRPGMRRLMEAIESGSFEVVVVDSLSRLTRDSIALGDLIRLLRERGVRVVSVSDGLRLSLDEGGIA